MLTTLDADFIQHFLGKLVVVILYQVRPYFSGTRPLVKAERALTSQRVNVDNVSLALLNASKSRLAIPVETMQPAGRVVVRENPGFLDFCRLYDRGGRGLNLRRSIGQQVGLAKQGGNIFVG